MADYDVSLGRELLPGLLSGQDGLSKLIEVVLNQNTAAVAALMVGVMTCAFVRDNGVHSGN